MKRRRVALTVTDHAVLRYIERAFGVDIARIRAHLAGRAMTAAEFGAVSVSFDKVRVVLENNGAAEDGAADIAATTALPRGPWAYRRAEKRR